MPSGIDIQGKLPAIEFLSISARSVIHLRHFEDSAAGLYHPLMSFISRLALSGAACAIASTPALAQRAADTPVQLTAADYARAEAFMTYNTAPLVLRTGVRPSWLQETLRSLLVSGHDRKGVELVLSRPRQGEQNPCDLAPCKAAEHEPREARGN